MTDFIVKLSEDEDHRHIMLEGEQIEQEDDFFLIGESRFRKDCVDYIYPTIDNPRPLSADEMKELLEGGER